jgi:DNA-binding YbaB/EbfC family protein
MKVNYNQMMKQAQKMQQDMAKAQENLKNETVEATSGGGMVKVTANGQGDILAIEIKPEAVDPDDIEMLQDMVLVAVNEAAEQARDLQAALMQKMTGGMNIPGLM